MIRTIWPAVLKVDRCAGLLIERFHLFPTFGAENGGQVIFIHNRFTGKIDEEKAILIAAAGIVVAVKPMMV